MVTAILRKGWQLLRGTGISVVLVAAASCWYASSTGANDATDESTEPNGPPVVHGSVEVTANAVPIPLTTIIDRESARSTVPLGDGSEVLRGVVGADLGRMGGHGFEPFVRGQSQGDLTVLLDGAVVHGGCPNRMDPATAYITTESIDRVVVIRGVQTVRYGPGAPGGTVLYERQVPDLGARHWTIDVGTGLSNWSGRPDLALDAAVGLGGWTLRALASSRDLESYQDGDGVEVRSAARTSSAMLMAGRLRPGSLLELSYEWADTTDALFAGAGMDAPESTAHILRARSEGRTEGGRFGWRVDAFYDTVDHLMDNYSLRPLRAPMALEVPTETSTVGLRGQLEIDGSLPLLVGFTVERAEADATRFGGPTADTVSVVQSIMWPGVRRDQYGLFIEGIIPVAPRTGLTYGARADRFSASAGRADEPAMGGNGPTPRQLWGRYYGETDATWSHSGVGALVRLEHAVGAWSLQAGLSRTLRPADATERFLGANSAAPAMRWLGNPALEPARTHQLDLGAVWSGGGSKVSLTLFAADVDEHQLRDRARGQDGVLQSDGAQVYRNVAARRYGVELDSVYRGSGPLGLSAGLWWVWAENTTDNRPIAQTPPLSGRVSAAWRAPRWTGSGTVRFAARQDRVDDDPSTGSGLDAGPTPGWVVLDLTATVPLGRGCDLAVGMANVFDRTYANHLNRGSLFDPDPVRVNEPGRTLWVRLSWQAHG